MAMLLIVPCLVLPKLGGAQSIEATVNRNQVTIEEQIHLQVVVEGVQSARVQLPDLSAFRVLERPQHRSVTTINGQRTSSVAFNFILIPRQVGKYAIGAASVEVGGKILSSEPFGVTVLDASEQPEQSRDYFLSATVSNETPFVGEQVLFTWRFYRRSHVEVANATLRSLEFGDLLAEDLGEVNQFQTTLEGVPYTVSEIRKALFPQRVGEAEIPPSELACQVALPGRRRRRSIFDLGGRPMEEKVLHTTPIQLQVRALPAAPPGFSGLVGSFDLRADLSKRSLQVGESTTLSLSLSGVGNVRMMNAPLLPDLSGFKIYDDKPSGSVDSSGRRLRGKKTYRKALVPLMPGNLEVPSIELVYFDPRRGSYETKRTRSLRLDVSPAEGREELMLTESVAPTTGKVAVRILADDILPIHRDLDALERHRISGWWTMGWGGAALAPPLGFLGLLLVRRRQTKFLLDSGLRRRQQALRSALHSARRIQQDKVAKYDRETLARDSSQCLRHYVGDKLGAEGSALTPTEVEHLLRERAVEEGTVRRTRELLERLEAAQYGAGSSDDFEHQLLARSLNNLLRDLDKQIGSTA